MTASEDCGFAGMFLCDEHASVHNWLHERIPNWRRVSIDRVIGRDVIESDRIVVADWRLFERCQHVRELLLQHRGKTIVMAGFAGEQIDSQGIAALRRFAGEIIAVGNGFDQLSTDRLLVPVTLVEPAGFGPAIEQAASLPAKHRGDVASWLGEASSYADRGDNEGAFVAAARALSMAPDQPGIVADVARLLARMGRSEQGEQLCRKFLLQRPDSPPVRRALNELQPSGS